MSHGGKRAGSGRKKGQATLDKEAAREYVRARVTAELGPLLDAQIANAKGLSYLVVRDKAGKFTKVSATAARALKGQEVIEVWEKDPSVQSFSDLLNRAIDKPKEQEITLTITDEAGKIAALQAGRERAAAARLTAARVVVGLLGPGGDPE